MRYNIWRPFERRNMYIWLTKTQAANQATHIQMKVKYAYIEDERSAIQPSFLSKCLTNPIATIKITHIT